MERIVHDLVPDSPEWHAFRLEHDGASEAAAMLGLSKTMSRTELLHMKATGTPREFSDFVQKHVLDRGKESEALARPIAAEIIGAALYPATCSIGRTSASCDGLDMADETAWEHKFINQDNAALVRAGIVPAEHMPQCQQVLMVTRAGRLLFMVSDGTRENMAYVWVYPDTPWFDRLRAGWLQFNLDRATYVPTVTEPKSTGRAPETLPALRIELTGAVTASNLADFKTTALGAIRSVNRELVTDQSFADAEQAVKWCGEVELKIKAAKDHALSQTASIDELFRALDDVSAEARRVRLDLGNLIERRKVEIKGELVAAARAAYEQHEAACRQDAGAWIMLIAPDFGTAIKGKRSVDSMRDALDTCLANAKIKASESASKIRASLTALDEESAGFTHLFADRLTFIDITADDVRMMVRGRIAEHRQAEEKRAAELAERERARIQSEERAKAEKSARDQLAAEQAALEAGERRQHEARNREAGRLAAEAEKPASTIGPDMFDAPAPTAAPITQPTIKLGQITEMLGFALTADFLRTLGFEPVARERSAVLYLQSSFPDICDTLVRRINEVRLTKFQS